MNAFRVQYFVLPSDTYTSNADGVSTREWATYNCLREKHGFPIYKRETRTE